MEKEARKKKSLRWYGREIRKNRDNYLMVAPYAVIFTVFTVIPVVLAIVMSFTYFNLLEPPQFLGCSTTCGCSWTTTCSGCP